MLIDYLPPIVKKIREMQAISTAEQPFFDEAKEEIENILCRVFVSKADEKGITRFEKIYGITPGEDETLAQRRVNILIRNIKRNISLSEVLTVLYNYTVNIELECDYNKDEATITLKDETTDIAIIYKALDEIAPLNVYIKEHLTTLDKTTILKSVLYEKMYYNYKLGKWKLGRLNFGLRGEKTKLGGDKVKLQPKLYSDMKDTIKSDIKKVIVNDELELSEFEITQKDNSVIANYNIRAADVKNIKKISFKSADGEEVATLNTDLNIDVDIEVTQEFMVKEATK